MIDKPICAVCLSDCMTAASFVETAEHGRLPASPGRHLIAAAREAADNGEQLIINNNSMAGFYAATTVRGTAVCAGHMYEVTYGRGKMGNPW